MNPNNAQNVGVINKNHVNYSQPLEIYQTLVIIG
jgi:hypothetical protein